MSAAVAGAGDERGGEAGRAAALARIVFAALVVACFAAFFVTQRLKHTPTAVQLFELTPSFVPGSHARGLEAISFKLAEADEVTVQIIDSKGDVVATLARDRPVPRYKQFSLRWNGRMGSARGYQLLRTARGRTILVARTEGAPAAPGEYRVQVSLRHQGRTVLSPRSFTLAAPSAGSGG